MPWDGTERRQKKRYGVKKLGVRYSKTGILGFLGGRSEKYLVLNISESGMYFMTKEPLSVGKTFGFELSSPDLRSPIRGRATVVWRDESRDHDAYKLGVRFARIGGKGLAQLRDLLASAVLDKIDLPTSIYLREIERF